MRGNFTDEMGYLTPWGQGQLDRLAALTGWVSYPGDIQFSDGDQVSQTAHVWLTQVSQRGNLPLPVLTAGNLEQVMAGYGVVV